MSSARDRELLDRLDRMWIPARRGPLRFLGRVVNGGAMSTLPDRYYLMEPIVPGGDESEGGTASFAAAGAAIPVVFLKTRPLAGERHVAHFAGGRWVADRPDPTGPISCGTCEIPRQNLIVSWTNALLGNGSTPLVFDGVNQWVSACANQLIIRLVCTDGVASFRVSYFTAGNCPSGSAATCQSPGQSPLGLTPDPASTCDPLYLRYTLNSGSCPTLASQGYTAFTVTG
ncbi:hypothetical protein [Paludisphaera soli]|uniref:hypothetical protein n=1 Tax=Paludisphaera soli TaxID=2712865 RepID=UPI0013EBCF2F|nr:hypothetical protein [Paludisphaera soli]